ncbi:MAG TPA: tRNA pseudouridine(55) synthase TruB [Phycisphaerales bacterium]|nr:tRNA pseudouridine(55) synthase TruB [Phycisphaerales bacterium]
MTSEHPSPIGLLVIDKPLHKTSMHVCANVRARLRRGGSPKRIKVGHGGTLDPLATGVLVILIGKATKLQDRIMVGQKRYLAGIDLAHTSRTDDREGPIEPIECDPVSESSIRAVLPDFIGTIMQRPPAFSAMKIEGRRAYHLARNAEHAGDMPSLKPRPVRIDTIDIVSYEWPILTLDISCGKGTYIRSLARDLGRTLGAGGMLSSLVRTSVGPFSIEDARTLDDLPESLTQHDLLPIPQQILDQSASDSSESSGSSDSPASAS